VFVAIAADANGVAACKPFYEKAGATFETLVDPTNAFGRAMNANVVPNGLFADESGRIVWSKIGGFEVRDPKIIEAADAFLSAPRADMPPPIEAPPPTLEALRAQVSASPRDAALRLKLGQRLLVERRLGDARRELETALGLDARNAGIRQTLASLELAAKRPGEAVKHLREALKLEPDNFIVRKQLWLIEHPERFHPEIDWAWQREQLKKERGG
jgi:tetratricopeptide (TPR) repeat protein